MTQQLSQQKLRASRGVESRPLPDGTELLKHRRSAEYLALDASQKQILEAFTGESTVQEVLCAMLAERPETSIRGFYLLVLQALEGGFLYTDEGEQHVDEGPELSGVTWCLCLKPGLAVALSVAAVLAGAWAMVHAQPALPQTVLGWIIALVVISLSLSLANVLAGCALAGSGRHVYAAGVCWNLGLPFFAVDSRDAFMGGRRCEATVALQTLAGAFLVLLLATGAASLAATAGASAVLGAHFALLALTSPFGNTPAHRLIHALFRAKHQLPRCGNAFFTRRLFRHLVSGSDSAQEERYLTVYSVYAIVWLSTVILFAIGLLWRQADSLSQALLFGPDLPTKLLAFVAWVVLAFLLLGPLGYEIFVVARNCFGLIPPAFFRSESAVCPHDPETSPTVDEIMGFLGKTILFGNLQPDALRAVAEAVSFSRVKRGTIIVRKGTEGEAVFVVVAGTVVVTKEDEAGQTRTVASLGPGDVFGEIALLDRMTRTATVQSDSDVELLSLQREDFQKLLVEPLGADRVRVIIQICSFLKRNALFSEWPDKAILNLASQLEVRDYARNDLIIREGAPNDAFHLLYEGECAVTRAGKGWKDLSAGDFFGEISLLKNSEAIADVRAATPVRCLRLGGERFLRFITQDVLTGVMIESTAESRLRENQKQR